MARRTGRFRAVGGGLSLAIVASFVVAAMHAPVGAQSDVKDEPLSEQAAVPDHLSIEELTAAAQAGRAQFGLDGGAAATDAVIQDPAAWERGGALGIPITAVEAQELERRFAVHDEAREVAATLRDDQGFAGVWLDFGTSTLHVAYTSPPSDAAALIAEQLPADGRAEVRSVKYSFEELESLSVSIVGGRFDVPMPAGVPVYGGGVDEVHNQVLILTDDASNSAGYASALGATFDVDADAFRFETFTHDQADENSGLGGQKLGDCSFGPYGWYNTVWGPLHYATTAAHCNDVLYHWNPNFHNPPWRMHDEKNVSNADVQSMYEDNGGLTAPTQYVEGWHVPDFRLTSVAPRYGGHDGVGWIVCHAGAVTQGVNNCGDLDSPLSFDCGSWTDMRRANASPQEPSTEYSSSFGDSGATVYGFVWGSYNVPLIGIHKGICQGKIFTFQDNARARLGLAAWYVG